MSNHIYLGNIKNKKKIKFISNFTLAIFIIFSAIYLYMASTIGIYINDEFLKKSPSLTTINYYAVSSNSNIQHIQLTNNIDKRYLIQIDENSAIISDIVHNKEDDSYDINVIQGEVVGDKMLGLSLNDFGKIALQENEVRRQPIYLYIVPLLFLITLSLLRKYAIEIHNKVFKGKIFSDKYFSIIDYLPIYFAYIVMALLTITL